MEPDLNSANKPGLRSLTPHKPVHVGPRSSSLRAPSTPPSKSRLGSGTKTPVGTPTKTPNKVAPSTPNGRSREAWSPQPRLYTGSVLYITHDLIKRVAKTQHMSEIRSLKLASADAKVSIVENLNNLPNLQELDLCDNKIEKMKGFDHLKSLKILLLSKNLISSLDCSETLARLTILDLSSNLLERIPLAIRNLSCLQALMLDHNKLTTLRDVTYLRALKNLTTLTITGNPMTELDHARLFIVYHIPTLNELDADFVTDEEREKAIERFSQEEIADLEMKLEEAKEARRQLQDRVDECETALSTARQSEATLKQTVSEISGKNTQLTHELSATSELLDKKAQEVATLSETLFELKEELAIINIDKSFDDSLVERLASTPAPDQRTPGRGPLSKLKSHLSPYIGQGNSTPSKLRNSFSQPNFSPARSPSTLFNDSGEESLPHSTFASPTPSNGGKNADDSMDAESWVELSIAESEARAKLAKEVDSARARIRAEEDRLRNFKEMLEEREKSLLETTGNFIAKTIAEVRQDIKGVGTGIDGVGHKVEDVQDEVEVMSGDVEELRRIVEKQEKMLADLQFKTQSAPATAQSGQYPGTPQPMMMGYGGAPVIISYPPNYAPTYPSPYPPSPHPHGSVPPSPYAPPQSSMNGYASGIHTPMQRTASFVDEEKDRTIRIQQDTIDRLNRTLSSGTVSGTQTPQASDRLHQVESLLVEKELTIRVQKDIIDQLKKTYDSMGHTPRDAETDADLEQLRMLKSMIEQKEQRIRELEANIDKLRSSFSDEEATLKARIKAAVNEQERAESELRKANSEKSELALRLQSRSLAVEQFDKNVEKLRATISQLHDELDDKARHSSDLQRQLDAKVRVTDELQEEVEEQAKSIVSLRTQLADQFRVAQELQNKLDDKERGRASLQRQLSDSKLSAEQVLSEKTRSLVGDVQRKLEEEEKAKLALAEQLRHSKLAIAQTMSSLAAAEERTKLVEPLKEQLAASNELAQSLRVQLAQLTDERTQIQENVAELQKKLMDAKREHDTQNSEHKELVQQQRRDAEAAASLQKRISELTSALDEAREESSGKSELIDDLQAEVESKNSVIDSQRKQMLEDTSIHKKLRALIDNHERILSEQSATISSLTDQLNEKDSKIFTLQREVDEAKLRESSHASQHNGSLDAYARQITQLNGAIDELKRTNSEKDIRLSTITSKNGDAESIIAQLRTDLQLQKEQAERSAQRAKADMQENRRALGVQQEAQEQLNVILETLRTSVQTLKVQVEEKSSVISAQQQLVEQLQAQLAEVPPDQSQAFVKRLVSLILEFPEGTSQPLPITVESGTDRLRQLILALLAKLVSRQAPAGSVRSPSSSPARQRSYSAIPFKPASAVVPTLNTSGSRSRPPSPPRSNGTNSPSMQESPPISPRTEGSAESDDSLLNNSGLTVDSSGSGDESRIDGLISRFGQSSRSAADRRRSWRAEESLIRAKLGAQAKGELTDAAKAEADVLASTSGRRNSNTPALPPGLRRALARSATISGSSYSRSNESDDDIR